MTVAESRNMPHLRIGIADDNILFREGLAQLLGQVGVEVTCLAKTGVELIDMLSADVPDAVILDIRMPPTFTDEGIKAGQRLRELYPGIPILFLSGYIVPSFLDAFENDFKSIGYRQKDEVNSVEGLAESLERVVDGQIVVDSGLMGELLRRRQSRLTDQLSEREILVLRLMAEGKSNAGISHEMKIAEKSVEAYIARLYTKLAIPVTPDSNRRVLAVLAWLRLESQLVTSDTPPGDS